MSLGCTSVDIQHLHLQYDRLVRHYESALKTKDEISFLDLAHALRVWVDMKTEVSRMADDRGFNLALRHYTAPKYIQQSLQGSTHTYIPLASGVESPDIQVTGLRITNRALSPEEIKQRAAMDPPVAHVSKMSFAEWLAAGVMDVPSGDHAHPHVKISREMVIKRVANILGASHPARMENNDPQENRFDQYILELHTIKIANGYPTTYYQLLEIAGELLARTKCLRDSAT